MSRTFSTNIGSVLSLKLFTKCGFKPKACQIRRTESWEMPASLAMSQLLQWVLAGGVVSNVFVTTSSTFSSEILSWRSAAGRIDYAFQGLLNKAPPPFPHHVLANA